MPEMSDKPQWAIKFEEKLLRSVPPNCTLISVIYPSDFSVCRFIVAPCGCISKTAYSPNHLQDVAATNDGSIPDDYVFLYAETFRMSMIGHECKKVV